MEIQWEDPPELAIAKARRSSPYLEFAIALKEHPERWAVLPPNGPERTVKGAAGTAQNIRRGATKGFEPKGAYETAVEGTKVWVRYVGAPEVPEADPHDDQGNRVTPPDPDDDGKSIAPAAVVREWARTHGLEVPDRGRLPEDLFQKYAQAVNAGEVGLPVRPLRIADQ